jgi:hypothetical protein
LRNPKEEEKGVGSTPSGIRDNTKLIFGSKGDRVGCCVKIVARHATNGKQLGGMQVKKDGH